MSWRQITFKNTLKTSRRYLGYMLSASLAVMVYFMFSSFTMNSTVEHGYMTRNAKMVLMGCQYVVLIFAIFFIFFFHSALLRLRSKEFGLFVVMGMTPSQVRRMVFLESLFLGALALMLGGCLGSVFTRLFLMGMRNLLEFPNSIPFYVPRGAILSTLSIFGILFLLEGMLAAFRVSRRTPKNLLLGGRVRQKLPTFSIWIVLLGVSCLAFAYYEAVFHSMSLTANVFPILITTSIGSYLLYSQIGIMIAQMLRKRAQKGILLLVVSRFSYRLKDNARVLTVVTLLTAMILSGMGSVFGMQSIIGQNSLHISPFSMMLAEQKGSLLPVTPDAVRESLHQNKISISAETETPILIGGVEKELNGRPVRYPVVVISHSEFERVRMVLREHEPALKPYLPGDSSPKAGHAIFYAPYPLVMSNVFTNPKVALEFAEVNRFPITIDVQSDTRIFNEQTSGVLTDFMLVVSDADYREFSSITALSTHWTIHGFLTPEWKHTGPVVNQLQSGLSDNARRHLTATVTSDTETRQMLSVMLFAGFFVSVLFFLACGSLIYFRLQSQQEEDRRQFRSLQRLGMQDKEIGRVMSMELFLLFFVPVAVALVHSFVAMVDFRHLVAIQGNAWPVFAAVTGLYTVCTALYYLVARTRHVRFVTSHGRR